MATFRPTSGVDETEATLIADTALQDTDGAEYRVGDTGLFVARGRQSYGDIGSVTGRGLYEAGFDGAQFVVAHEADNYHYAPIGTSLSFTSMGSAGSGTLPIVGVHISDKHYTANGSGNRRLEWDGAGVTMHEIGMNAAGFGIGTSISGQTGLLTATTGLEYWLTEYDAVRGIESIFGSTTNTGAFSGVSNVVVFATGTSSNANATTLRWYRSVDGGGYPDGGLIRETPIGTTFVVDGDPTVASLNAVQYGIISIGGLDTDRDEKPGTLTTIFGPFKDSLMGVMEDEPRVLRFTPAGYPESWPSGYGVPLDTHRRDEIITGCVLPGRVGVFCNDSVHVIYRLPRDSDSVFASGEAQDIVTDQRGTVSRRGVCVFTPPGAPALAAFVARDGIWATNLDSPPVPLTDRVRWAARVDATQLYLSRLLDDPHNRRLAFIYRRATDTDHNTGIWYLDYQDFAQVGTRITFADHGPLADAVIVATPDGYRRAVSIDSRLLNGGVYIEANQDADGSQMLDSSGSVRFRMRTKEYLPAGPTGAVSMGGATWMHDAGPERLEHRFYFNRRDDNPEMKLLPDSDSRTASTVQLQRNVNSFSLELQSVGTTSYGVHWYDIENFDAGLLGARKGA